MDDARARELLKRERERIEALLLDRESDEANDEPHSDPGDDATRLADRELDAGRVETLRADLAAIDRAEKRVDEGTYGLSVVSGDPIPDERLEAVPWAERTVDEDEPHRRNG
jgi:RNA polymerase-binding transcription factor